MNNYNNGGYVVLEESYSQVLVDLESDEGKYNIYGYERNARKLAVYHAMCILFFGIPYIIIRFFTNNNTVKYSRCSLQKAQFILVTSEAGDNYWRDISEKQFILPKLGQVTLRFFRFQRCMYIWDSQESIFISLDNFMPPETLNELMENSDGLTELVHKNLFELYGPNKIEVEIKSYWQLFMEEIFTPFYFFQAFSILLWSFDDYLLYALCVLFLTLFSSITALLQTRKQSEKLHELVESSSCKEVNVIRFSFMSKHPRKIDPSELVPGDLIVIPPTGIVMPCDAVLLSGHCIVNESMLTGESVPVTKTPPHSTSEEYSLSLHKRHTLFCGTHVIQTRYFGDELVLARVVRTGYYTAKGCLVKSILFPTPVGLQFYKDCLKFIMVMFVIAAWGMAYCMYLYYIRHADVSEMIIRALDIITIVVPPALPAAMTIGIVYSQSRLKKLDIFCISPPRINVCGKIKLACFDKTGTLTHDGLDFDSIVPCNDAKFEEQIDDTTTLNPTSIILQAMACCHSLTRINGQLTGDPLDLTMFESSLWELETPEVPENAMYDIMFPTVVKPKFSKTNNDEVEFQIGIIREFAFSSTLQCMSVICRQLGARNMVVFTKGAPEKLCGMCVPDSVPIDFAQRLAAYTTQGYRVIALAYKSLPKTFKWKEAQKAKRDSIECDLSFLGFLIMRNALKDETEAVIKCLMNADIRTVMITGDNVYTAISVARDCGMIGTYNKVLLIKTIQDEQSPESTPKLTFENIGGTHETDKVAINLNFRHYRFAMEGKTWSNLKTHYPDLIPKLLVNTTVFARFQPDQKTQLIKSLQSIDYVVSMVGDGANDCGALKAAHVGVSLSQAEASVAAPFSSKNENISCIVSLMLEGRCALVTSFAVFKYMALYSLIQFFTVLILYKHFSILGDYQYLFIDLIVTTSLAVTIGRQGPADKLTPKRPMGSLISARNIIPLILQMLLCGFIQLAAFGFLVTQKWFVPVSPHKEEIVLCWENTVVFVVSSFQYIILALVYSKGRPYRQMLITNFWFLFSALTLVAFLLLVVVYPPKMLAEFFEVIYLTGSESHEKKLFMYKLLLFPVVHLILAVGIEVCMADRVCFKTVINFITRKKVPKNKYKILLEETENDFSWLSPNLRP